MAEFPRVAKLKTARLFEEHISRLPIQPPFDSELLPSTTTPLADSIKIRDKTIGNRFCILPMEGWDGDRDGNPTELTRRRWRRFGASGAKLIWGGEAVAVHPEGRANPNQLLIGEKNLGALSGLRDTLITEHESHFGTANDLSVGLQLTHSGRFARPFDSTLKPKIIYAHPILDRKFDVDTQQALMTDDELSALVDNFIEAATRAERIGFEWVDIKHCHGYLGHELLSGYDRPGKYGGSFENRTRFLRDIVTGIRGKTNSLQIGVRLSVFDFVPYKPGDDRIGVPATDSYKYAFGANRTGLEVDLEEPRQFMDLLQQLGIELICTTAGSPYYVPHIQRPAAFPPSDGYMPPEDPLIGVARQIQVTSQLKESFPQLVFVGSGYSYLQDWLPNVAQAAVRNGLVDSVGLGRMVLSYHDLPADILAGKTLDRKRICRTFSDCTTAPRNGMVSGCYPLDQHYKSMPEYRKLVQIKKEIQRQ